MVLILKFLLICVHQQIWYTKFYVLLFFSATDALKGEGLQEGVDWLQGMFTITKHNWECMSWLLYSVIAVGRS